MRSQKKILQTGFKGGIIAESLERVLMSLCSARLCANARVLCAGVELVHIPAAAGYDVCVHLQSLSVSDVRKRRM